MRGGQWARAGGERGSIFVSGLMLTFFATVLGVALFDLAVVESRLVVDQEARTQARYAAETGLNRAWQQMANGDGTNDFAAVKESTFSPTTLLASGSDLSGSYTVTKCLFADDPKCAAPASGFWVKSTGTARGRQAIIYARFTNSLSVFDKAIETEGAMTFLGGGAVVCSFNSAQTTTTCSTPPCPFQAGVGGNEGNDGDIQSRNGDITMDDTHIKGDATAGGASPSGDIVMSGSSLIDGTTTQHAPSKGPFTSVQPCNTYSGAAAFPNTNIFSGYSTDDGRITGPHTLNNGDLTVSGGNLATLAPGAYCFHKVTVSGGSSLKVTGPTIIYATDKVTDSGGSFINTTNDAANLLLLSSYTGNDNGVVLSGGSGGYMTIYAPDTEVELTGSATVYGAIIAKTFKSSGGADVCYDEHLADSGLGGGGGWTRGSWTLVQNY